MTYYEWIGKKSKKEKENKLNEEAQSGNFKTR